MWRISATNEVEQAVFVQLQCLFYWKQTLHGINERFAVLCDLFYLCHVLLEFIESILYIWSGENYNIKLEV